MSYEQYWYGDVWLIEAYREADKIRQQRFNTEAWLQGMYVYDAIAKLSPILHAFAKKGTKPKPYPDKPYNFGEEKEKKQNKKQLVENERLRATLYFKNWARSAEKHFQDK